MDVFRRIFLLLEHFGLRVISVVRIVSECLNKGILLDFRPCLALSLE